MIKILRAVSISAALVLVLSGCQALLPQAAAPGPSPIKDSSIAADYEPFYTQSVGWRACGQDRVYCAKIEVPANWEEPNGERLKIALAYRKADNLSPIGSIIFNPGGPGASGVSWLTDSAEQLGTKDLRANFNMVGFDPRGVGQSEPKVKCLDTKDTTEFLYGDSDYALGSADDIADTRKNIKKFIDACVQNTGPNIGLIDTVSTARDLDVIRSLFGESQINYLGYSYGTFIGATYAELFADRVGRMVLDGAINPLVSEDDQNLAQLIGFDQALKNYLTDCLANSDCPFSGSLTNAQKQISKLLLSIEAKSLPAESQRRLTIWAAITGIIMPLYSATYWPALSQAFDEALNGNGSTLLALADAYNDRNEDGTFASNTLEANVAVSCLDGRQPADSKSIASQNARVLKASPTLGRYWQFGALTCEQWPYPVSKSPNTYRAAGSKPILVIGTTGDPATPYSQAVQLANDVLENGHMITYNGEGHTAYGLSSKCINKVVDDYFILGTVPGKDPDCS